MCLQCETGAGCVTGSRELRTISLSPPRRAHLRLDVDARSPSLPRPRPPPPPSEKHTPASTHIHTRSLSLMSAPSTDSAPAAPASPAQNGASSPGAPPAGDHPISQAIQATDADLGHKVSSLTLCLSRPQTVDLEGCRGGGEGGGACTSTSMRPTRARRAHVGEEGGGQDSARTRLLDLDGLHRTAQALTHEPSSPLAVLVIARPPSMHALTLDPLPPSLALSLNQVFVGNLPFSVNDDSIKDIFAKVGPVTDAQIIHRGTRSLGYGFVTYTNEADAAAAVSQLDKTEISGRQVNVEVAKPMPAPGAVAARAAHKATQVKATRDTANEAQQGADQGVDGEGAVKPKKARKPVRPLTPSHGPSLSLQNHLTNPQPPHSASPAARASPAPTTRPRRPATRPPRPARPRPSRTRPTRSPPRTGPPRPRASPATASARAQPVPRVPSPRAPRARRLPSARPSPLLLLRASPAAAAPPPAQRRRRSSLSATSTSASPTRRSRPRSRPSAPSRAPSSSCASLASRPAGARGSPLSTLRRTRTRSARSRGSRAGSSRGGR